MREIELEPLTAEAFAPFGQLLTPCAEPGRRYFDAALGNLRPEAWPSLSLSLVAPSTLPLVATRMEMHARSSQSFVPLGPARFLVVVAPDGAPGEPDMASARAFLATGGQGVTYRTAIWHHPMTVLDDAVGFAVFVWRDGGPDDETLTDIEPVRIMGGRSG